MYRKRKRPSRGRFLRRKKTRSSRRRRINKNSTIYMGPRNFPNKAILNFTFCNQYRLTSAIASYAQRAFFGNSIYDCLGDGTNLTATPYADAFDIWNRVSVIESTIELTIQNNGLVPTEVTVFPYDFSTTGVADPVQWAENNNIKRVICDGTGRGGSSMVKIRMKNNTNKFLNINYKDSRASSAIGTTPNVQWFWIVGIRVIGSGFPDIYYNARVTYRTFCSSRFIVQT